MAKDSVMITAVQQVLESFDALPDREKHEATVEILRRYVTIEGDVSEEGLVGIADELFRTLDDEETGRAPA